jgi:GlcNAc-P-P-Und epimerase
MNRRILVTGGSGFIGTRLVSDLIATGAEVLNIDLAAPKVESQKVHWRCVDIERQADVESQFAAFRPDAVVHLAAKADFDPHLEAFRGPNVEGSRHVLNSASMYQARRVILTSTQYVNGPLTPFDDDLVFHPVNAYGESKIEMEKLVRSAAYGDLDWIIVRPTNVWGPFHPRFPSQMWNFMNRGLYLHPGGSPIMRAYGYVGNVSGQIIALLGAPAGDVRHRVLYVGDAPIDSGVFLDTLSKALRGAPVRRVPLWLLQLAGRTGDQLCRVGIKAPLFTDRVVRMTTNHLARDETIWKELDYEPIDLETAVHETVSWLRETYPERYRR